MSNKKVKVPLGGKMVDGIELDFDEIEEKWNEYQVKDGTKIKMKLVVTRIVKTKEYNQEGDPVYFINSQNILVAKVPPELKKGVN